MTSRTATKAIVIGPTETLLDGARALADWMLKADKEVEHYDFQDRQQLMAALRTINEARRLELKAKGVSL